MKISEPGEYKTRCGETAIILGKIPTTEVYSSGHIAAGEPFNPTWPWIGYVIGDIYGTSWTEEGKAMGDGDGYDIVETLRP